MTGCCKLKAMLRVLFKGVHQIQKQMMHTHQVSLQHATPKPAVVVGGADKGT